MVLATVSGAVPVARVEVICPEVVRPVNVPTDVNEELTTVELRVVPVKVPAADVIVIGAVPSKLTPLIARGVAREVAVDALPVVDPDVPVTFPVTLPVNDPTNPVAVKTPVDGTNDREEELVSIGRLPEVPVTQVG